MIKNTLKMARKNRFMYLKYDIVLNGTKNLHVIDLNDVIDPQNHLDYYSFDPEFSANEYMYKLFCKQILEINNEEYVLIYDIDDEIDNINKGNMLNGRMNHNLELLERTVHFIVNSSCSYENSVLKLINSKLKPGQELDLCLILLNFCCQHKIYKESLGHATQILCQLNKSLVEPLEDLFIDSYTTAHSFDKMKLKNVAKLFAHLLFTNTISWMVLSAIQLNETDTTYSRGTYIKILFHELVDHMGLENLYDHVQDPVLKEAFEGIFLGDNKNNPKFAINFFMSIGLGGLIDKFRSSIIFKPKKVSPVRKLMKY